MKYSNETIKGVTFNYDGTLYEVSTDGKFIHFSGETRTVDDGDLDFWANLINDGTYTVVSKKEVEYAIY